MKKSSLLLSALFCLGTGAVMSQYKILHSFNDTTGAFPLNTLTLSGKSLYGTAFTGGANGYGCIFSIDTTGVNYKDIYDFDGTHGAYPQGGSLKLSGNRFYGMASGGGASDSGCVYSININGTGYKDLLDFTGPNGSVNFGSVVLSGKKLFGMTFTGGKNIAGNVFTVDTNGNNYKNLLNFNDTNGQNPYGDITILGAKLYGMSGGGGAMGYGNIFSIDSNGTNFTDLFDFDGTNGAYPNNILTQGGSQFFAVTNAGGTPTLGNVFSIDTSGTDFKDLLDFNGTSSPFGEYPYGDVIRSMNVLYGMAIGGGVSDSGTIFSVDTDGTNYTDLYDFTGPDGESPFSNLTLSGHTLYGTASGGGGANYAGVIFSYNLEHLGINNLKNTASVKLYPNPNDGRFTIQMDNGQWTMDNEKTKLEIYNVLGEKVYSQLSIVNYPLSIDLSSQPNGVYFYRILSDTGNLVDQGKLVIQK